MSWLIKHRKKDDKYRLWTTISDGWITDWLTRDEMIKVVSFDYKEALKDKVRKLQLTFPNGWHDKDSHARINDERYKTEADWHKLKYEELTKGE